ncbi:MAG TPA: alginate export family protein [Sphingomonas sp.]|jgi:hypothetical protein
MTWRQRGDAVAGVASAWIGALAGASAQVPPAREGLNLAATERVRLETIDGQARAGFRADDTLLNLRTTALAEYRDGPLTLAAELWDSRVYGGKSGSPITTNEVNALELVQLSATLRLSPRVTVQAGRFVLNLGSRRLIAADDYRNTTNGYTGVRVDLAPSQQWRATAIYVLPQQRRPDDRDALFDNAVAPDREGLDLVLWGGLISRARTIGPAMLEASFFHLGERDRAGRPTRDRSLDTAALRVLRDPAVGRFDYEVEAIVQRGQASASTAPTAPTLEVRAWFVHADAGYTLPGGWKPRVSVEVDHASGDGRGARFTRFDTLFGMRRADLAPAGLYNAIARTNVSSPGIRIEAVPSRSTDAFVSYRVLYLASRTDSFAATGVRDPTGLSGGFAGHQVDARIRHRLNPSLTLEADGVLLAKGAFLRTAPGAPSGRWTRYVSLNLLASF